MFCSSETANSMASPSFSKENLSLSSRNVSLVDTRTHERSSMADTNPLSFSESMKKTTKPPMLMRRCRLTIKELMNLNTRNLCFTKKEIIANLGLAELASPCFSKVSLPLSARNDSLVNARTHERSSMADTNPLLVSESVKKTSKRPILMSRRRFTIKELMDLNTQNLCSINKEIITNLGLAELGLAELASPSFSKVSLSLSSRNDSLVNARTHERSSMADTNPLLFSESIKKTNKRPMLMSSCRFTIKELMDLNIPNLCFMNKEIIANLGLVELGLGILTVEKGFVKGSRKRSIDDAYELGCERKRKKTSEKINPLPDDCLAPKKSNTTLANNGTESNSLSKFSQLKFSSISSTVDSNLRAAMIKSRFADTISRAQEKMILSQGDKVEKEKLERRKAEVEMKIKNAQCKLKEQRQKERKDARIALEKMERTVEWNHALDLAQEFDKLIGVKYHCGY